MTKSDKPCAPLGLDVGTSRIVLSRRKQQEYEFQAQRNAFVRVPFSGVTQTVFEKQRVPHSVDGGELLVYGNEAENFANLFHAESRRPMIGGALNPDEPEGPEVIRHIVGSLAGHAQDPAKVCVSLPATLEKSPYHEAVLRQMLEDLGYEVATINEGLAVVYSELEDTNYTGIGVSCGGGLSNVCLAYLSVPVLCFSTRQAGDFVDSSAAAAAGETATRVRLVKEEAFHLNGQDGDKIRQALTVYYDEMIAGLVKAMCEAFSDRRAAPRLRQPVPIVLSGGSALPPGFRERFDQALKAAPFPIAISEVRLASDPLNATAKGALMAALAV